MTSRRWGGRADAHFVMQPAKLASFLCAPGLITGISAMEITQSGDGA